MTSSTVEPGQQLHDFYQRYLDLVSSYDFDRLDECIHDIVNFNGMSIARDDLIAGFRGNIAAVPDLSWKVEDLLIDGNRIAVRFTMAGTPVQEWLGLKPNGARVTFAEMAFYEVEEGRFKTIRSLMDMDSLRAQLLP
ncbi:SnoaL-like domain-containing protein [Kribbella sandramycini]|uniref:Putative ester cyclase n=1 Tax=Kribbella sandramycini TaxID=60450 RepID=A0A7Y4NXM1_9ACTN|nr:ester cyclase [Kribbella sandramycini]MBB6567798.1 putative ester cyclase [Kribbella sandramycini]NOL39606.1 SnoaL-like domain-containing protein [Kribbella sandramycini]